MIQNNINDLEKQWRAKFNELCYEVFYSNPKGQELLRHMENKFFRSPVAIPGQDSSWAYLNEGRNEHIRSYTMAIQQHINEHNKPVKKK